MYQLVVTTYPLDTQREKGNSGDVLQPDPLLAHISAIERLQLMRLDRRAPRTSAVPPILRFSAFISNSATHWDRVSAIRSAAASPIYRETAR